MTNVVRRRTEEKELKMAEAHLSTRNALEARGMVFMGSLGMAAKAGYFTPRACEKAGWPVTAAEWQKAAHFAMMIDCYADLCLVNAQGNRVRPCLPVFYRGSR